MIKRVLGAVLFVFALSFSVAGAGEGYLAEPKFRIEEVIAMSKQRAVDAGYDPAKYFVDYVKYELAKKEWIVHFQGYVMAPGNDFMIWLAEISGELTLMRGE